MQAYDLGQYNTLWYGASVGWKSYLAKHIF